MKSKIPYSVKLYDERTKEYEYLTEVLAEDKEEAIKKFRHQSGWVDLPYTKIFIKPPICR